MANNYTGSSSTMAYIERMKKLGALQAALAEAKTTAERERVQKEIAKETSPVPFQGSTQIQKNTQSTGSPFVDLMVHQGKEQAKQLVEWEKKRKEQKKSARTSSSPTSSVSTWQNPDEVDPYTGGLQESGTRNLVDPSVEIMDQIKEAIQNDDRRAIITSLWRYSNLGPYYATAIDYDKRFQFRLMNSQIHVIDRENNYEKEFDNAGDAVKYIYDNKTGTYTYTNRYGNTVTKEWIISNKEFLDADALTQQQITDIMNSKNPGLVERGFDIAVYGYAQRKGINPKTILATLAQEQSWCKKGGYKSAFGVGPGGNPIDFAEGEMGGLANSVNIFLRWFSYAQELEEEGSLEPMLINYDRSPYPETRAKYENTQEWQKNNPRDFEFMEKGQYVTPVNAAMYAKLKYTPWVDFPPQNSHPLDLWHEFFRSF